MLLRVKRQMHVMQQEEHALAVYAAEGWRGGARKKVQLTHEARRSREALERRRAAIREVLRLCDEPPGLRPIPAELFNEDGELDGEEIFCAVCGGYEATDDDDVILCDGPCNCAFHQNCLDPPIDVSKLPEDEGWLCPACDCKAGILTLLHEKFGLWYEMKEPWSNILPPSDLPELPAGEGGSAEPEEAANGGGDGDGSSGDAGADDDGDGPSRKRRRRRRAHTPVAPGAPQPGGWLAAELPSEDEEDGDFNAGDDGQASEASSSGPSSEDESEAKQQESGGSGGSGGSASGSDEMSASGSKSDDDEGDGGGGSSGEDESGSRSGGSEESSGGGEHESGSGSGLGEGEEEGEGSDGEVVHGKRQRRQVDYVALHRQMFGSAPAAAGEEGHEEDDDYDPDLASPPPLQGRRVRVARAAAEHGTGSPGQGRGRGRGGGRRGRPRKHPAAEPRTDEGAGEGEPHASGLTGTRVAGSPAGSPAAARGRGRPRGRPRKHPVAG